MSPIQHRPNLRFRCQYTSDDESLYVLVWDDDDGTDLALWGHPSTEPAQEVPRGVLRVEQRPAEGLARMIAEQMMAAPPPLAGGHEPQPGNTASAEDPPLVQQSEPETYGGDLFGPVIYAYSRADAISDGVLVDVTDRATAAGFRVPTALTCGVWAECVQWPENEAADQDETGRLWDVLCLAHAAAVAARPADRVNYQVGVVPAGSEQRRLVTLTLHVGPGDRAEPVVTIMLPGED